MQFARGEFPDAPLPGPANTRSFDSAEVHFANFLTSLRMTILGKLTRSDFPLPQFSQNWGKVGHPAKKESKPEAETASKASEKKQ